MSLPASQATRRRPGAPIGNTNAVKHGRRSRTRGQALNLMAMIQQAHPDWIANPRQVPEPLAALIIALAERDNSIREAVTRRKPLQVHLNKGLIGATRQIQSELENRRASSSQTVEDKQPTTINSDVGAEKQ